MCMCSKEVAHCVSGGEERERLLLGSVKINGSARLVVYKVVSCCGYVGVLV